MVRPLFVILSGMVFGELLAVTGPALWLSVVCVIGVGIFGCFAVNYRPYILCFTLAFFCGLLIFYQVSHVNLLEDRLSESEAGILEGKVTQIKRDEEKMQLSMILKDVIYEDREDAYQLTKKCKVFLSFDKRESEWEACRIYPSDRIRLTGNIAFPEEARNPGQFHQLNYYRGQGIFYLFYGEKATVIGRPKWSLGRVAFIIRQDMEEVYDRLFPGEQAGLLYAMVLGDKSGLSEDVKKLYEENGVAHLLAVSGLHISIVGGKTYRFWRKRKFGYILSSMAAMVILLFYAIMTGFGNSVIRAFLMFLVYLGAEILGTYYDLISSMSLAGILMLLEHPYRILDGGFVISYASILAIGLVLPLTGQILQNYDTRKMRDGIKKEQNKIIKKIRDQLIASFGIYLVTAPVTMYFFYENTPYSILLNPLILPWMSPLMLFAFAVGILGIMAKHLLGFLSYACIICRMPVVFILTTYEKLFYFFRRLPGALWITGCPSVPKLLIIYSAEGIILYLLLRGYFKRALSILLLSVGGLLILFRNPAMLVIMDIGQGDCILLRSPEGYTAMIDCGSSSEKKIFSYIVEPVLSYYGIGHLDYLVFTHPDLDHICGIEEMLEKRYPVKYLLTGTTCGEEEPNMEDERWVEEEQQLFYLAQKNGSEIRLLDQNDQIRMGSMRLTCLYPYEGLKIEDKNESSVVLSMEYGGVKGLFTGDLGQEHEPEVMKAWSNCGRIDILKVGHHGSKNSSGEEFLHYFSPVSAYISAGRRNRYGHPHTETINRLHATGCEIIRTDETGAIITIMYPGKYKTISWLKKE